MKKSNNEQFYNLVRAEAAKRKIVFGLVIMSDDGMNILGHKGMVAGLRNLLEDKQPDAKSEAT